MAGGLAELGEIASVHLLFEPVKHSPQISEIFGGGPMENHAAPLLRSMMVPVDMVRRCGRDLHDRP